MGRSRSSASPIGESSVSYKGGRVLFDQERDDRDNRWTMELRRRSISRQQMHRFEGYMSEIFAAFGLDLHTPATEETPQRFLSALFEATEGYDGDPKLLTVFETECRGGPDCRLSQVIEGPIHFFSLCEHHALPFYGHAYVGKPQRFCRAVSSSLGYQASTACDHCAGASPSPWLPLTRLWPGVPHGSPDQSLTVKRPTHRERWVAPRNSPRTDIPHHPCVIEEFFTFHRI